jgi:putative ABC transport system permease protein
MKWLWFAVKNVLRNRRRSLVTVLITAVGTAGVLIGGGFALFTYQALANMAARDTGQLILAHHDYFDHDEDVPMQFGLDDFQRIRQQLLQDDRVRTVLPRLQFSGLISNGDKSSVFIGTGVDPEQEFQINTGLKIVDGDVLRAAATADKVPEVILGSDLAKQMKAKSGSGLTLLTTTTAGSLNAIDVRVRGVVSVGMPEIDKRLIYVSLPTAQQLLLTDKVSTLSVYLAETEQTDDMAAQVRTVMPSLAVQTWRDQAFYYIAVRGVYNRIFGLLGAVIVIMVLFSVSNTLGMAVVERTREIGTLRALGTLPGQIVRAFALEGLVLGMAGVVAGMIIAFATSTFFQYANVQMPPPPGRSVGYPIHVNVSAELYLITLGVIVALATIAACLVSRKAAAKPIVEALGHV